jgi:MFS family permease
MAALAVALVLLPLVRTYTHVLIYGAIMGIAGGVVTVVFFSVWGQVFGRAHLGRIQGCAQMMTVFASAVGPLLLAETLRATGSYNFIFNLLAVFTVLLGVAAWFVALPARHFAHGSDRIILSTESV